MTSHWTAQQVALLRESPQQTIPFVDPAQLSPILPELDLWDLWPLQESDGATSRFDGWALWFVLSAPALSDPEARHAVARIRLIAEREGEWRDCGNALPDGFNPGSREWAGSARHDPARGTVTLFWTVAGLPGEAHPTFAQRMFETTGTLVATDGAFTIAGWTPPREIAGGPIPHYMLVTQAEGVPGFIKGFRDPAFFRDPANGETYLLFTGSLRGTSSAWNGCIGLLRKGRGGWDVLPPLLSADGLNNEMERPHIVHSGGRYYLFWSTQRKVFTPGGPGGPNGLYGMIADSLAGPWRPLNGSALVAANPPQAPFQAYSWWVTTDLTVHGFVDYPASDKGNDFGDAAWRRAQFGGVPAPTFRIALDDDRAGVTEG